MDPFFIGILLFLLIASVISAVYVAIYGSRRALQERYAQMALTLRQGHAPQDTPVTELADKTRTLLQWMAARIPESSNPTATAKLARNLARAGLTRFNAIRLFRVIRMLSAASGAVLGLAAGLLFAHSNSKVLLIAFGSGAIGAYGPVYYLARRARIRQSAIARQLSDVLDLLVVCMEAGLGLFEAIKVVGEETDRHGQAIGSELMLVAGEVSAGATLGQSLRSLSERTAVEDIRPLAATLIQSEQLGAQVAPALRASSDALRTRRRLRAEEAAQKSTIKILFPLVLFVLPAMLIAILAPAIIQAMRTLNG
jgi:tight adherence protein C